MRSTPTRLLLALPVAAIALSLSACGPGRPSTSEVADGLHDIFAAQELDANLYTHAASVCLAEHLVASELSDATLTAIADGRDEPHTVADRDLTVTLIKEHSPDCLGE